MAACFTWTGSNGVVVFVTCVDSGNVSIRGVGAGGAVFRCRSVDTDSARLAVAVDTSDVFVAETFWSCALAFPRFFFLDLVLRFSFVGDTM